ELPPREPPGPNEPQTFRYSFSFTDICSRHIFCTLFEQSGRPIPYGSATPIYRYRKRTVPAALRDADKPATRSSERNRYASPAMNTNKFAQALLSAIKDFLSWTGIPRQSLDTW